MMTHLHRDNPELAIFLDVDGVLTHKDSIEAGRSMAFQYSFKWAAQIDQECAKRVVRIVRETGALLVISSTWRKFGTHMTGLKRALITAGMDRNEIRGAWEVTPVLPEHGDSPRGNEILAWLAEHPEIKRHIVLDDNWAKGCTQLSHPLPCHFSGGLQDSHADEAIEILLREPLEIKYMIGDATEPKGDGTKIIVHICNDIGAWGRGFVMALSKKWPEPEKSYRRWHTSNNEAEPFALGNVQIVRVSDDTFVCNLVGQRNIRSRNKKEPIRYKAVRKGLEKLGKWARYKDKDASIHMPRIGCGLAGGDWETIGPIVQETLCDSNIPVTVYDLKQ